jgi:hypothetical protein
MRQESAGPFLSAVFVDYDNIYLSLKRKSDEAAKRFAKDAALWLKGIETGLLITPTNTPARSGIRRIVMNRCYGNPVPRRNPSDNSTDMNSFPFVRHHFLRAGFEIVDCPPLTAQLKNSSDIRMVMDVRDYLTHDTYFDEFVILSGDADFTPVLHRLRAHARRTVVFANDYTAAPYTAISDGEVREANLITLLLEGRIGNQTAPGVISAAAQEETARRDIIAEVVAAVETAPAPVPLEVLADRAVRAVGHERTIGTGWAGAGGFRELLAQALPDGLRMTDQAPYLVVDVKRHGATPAPIHGEPREMPAERSIGTSTGAPLGYGRDMATPRSAPAAGVSAYAQDHIGRTQSAQSAQGAPYAPGPTGSAIARQPLETSQAYLPQREAPAEFHPPLTASAQPPAQNRGPDTSAAVMSRIFEACQAPLLGPQDYRVLLEVMAQEINDNNINGTQTILNIVQRCKERGLEIRRDDARFVLDVVSETDPWFEQGASANLFAGRFRNFVVARCRGQGLNLSADELDLIEAWFAGNATTAGLSSRTAAQPSYQSRQLPAQGQAQDTDANRFRALEDGRQHYAAQRSPASGPMTSGHAPTGAEHEAMSGTAPADYGNDEFPRIVRTRLRG